MSQLSGNSIAALRLYFPVSLKVTKKNGWARFGNPTLASYLLEAAKQAGIQQVILHPINSGYLPGERLSHYHPELMNMKHPQCLELLDTEQKLREFLHWYSQELQGVHAVLLQCELPLRSAAAAMPSSEAV
ncbi:hypothetical protein TUM12370_30090 [Salmonella enterica subsp. enterica serovar Choleraesuis]|nr:hypothetical protein TUM12370_30090 [Salmonella enterica subsp. enterica serovar Choleraesuis]